MATRNKIKMLFCAFIILLLASSCDKLQDLPKKASNEPGTGDVEVPRTHLGITLGDSYEDAKKQLQKLGFTIVSKRTLYHQNNPLIKEVKDGYPKEMRVYNGQFPYNNFQNSDLSGYKYLSDDIKQKYKSLAIVFYDEKVLEIQIRPLDYPEIRDRLFEKYNFEKKVISYNDGTGLTYNNYYYNDGKTTIFLNGEYYAGNMIAYTDNDLRSQYFEYIASIDKAKYNMRNEDLDRRASEY